jgi:glycerol-3-phosphate acyltransferase PlsY
MVNTLWFTLNGLLLLIAYLLGSIPTGYWAGKLLRGIDIREHGSGSTGATNVLRTLGKEAAIVVLLVDILKGVGAIALVRLFYSLEITRSLVPMGVDTSVWLPWMITLAGMLALLGHSKSIFLNFTGGKSVATSLGVLLTMNWVVGLGTLGVFLLVLLISRIVSLSSIAGAIAVAALMFLNAQPLPYLLFGVAGGLYVILRHQGNIQRLLAGTEPRLGQKLGDENA